MVKIYVTIQDKVRCIYSLKQDETTDLYSLVSGDLDSLYKKFYNLYKKDEHVANYHFEYGGALFDEKMKFVCKDDMTFALDFQIVLRNGKITSILYNTIS